MNQAAFLVNKFSSADALSRNAGEYGEEEGEACFILF